MIKKILVLLSLITLLSAFVFASEAQTQLITEPFPFYRSFTELNLDISGNVTLTGPRGGVIKAEISLSQYPRENKNVDIMHFNPNPDISYINESVKFEYGQNDIKSKLTYVIYSGLMIKQDRPIIRTDPKFPISNIPNEFSKYTESSEKIIMSRQISNKAAELVQNSEGVFEASFNLAKWVNENIAYLISPDTEGVVQDSEWVYNNKIGVCDEITTLFIAMTRSVGIPSRFISGMAFTDITKDFGNHAWAEVYFPEYGWVPFDVTYSQFGWVDSNHIVLSRSEKATTDSVNVRITGGNVEIDATPLAFETEVTNIGAYDFPRTEITIETLSNHITPGSYNVIDALVKNNEAGLQAISIQLSNVNSMEIIGNLKQFLLIPPYNTKSVRWIVKVNNSLNKQALHRFPVIVSTNYNVSKESEFNVSVRGIKYSKSFIDNMLLSEAQSNLNAYSSQVGVSCDIKSHYFTNELSTIDCKFANNGNKKLNNLKACILSKCKMISITKNSEENVSFDVVFNNIGLQTYIINISNSDIQKREYINFNVIDVPDIKLDLGYPKTAEFNDNININLNLTIKSYSRPLNLVIDLTGSGIEKHWELDKMNIDQLFLIKGQGKNLNKDLNSFTVHLSWNDEKGRQYSKEQSFEINLVNLNFWQKIYVYINSLLK